MRIRAVTDADLPAIQAIYAHHVATSLGTFETEPPTVPEMRVRCTGIVQAGFPYLVGELDGRIVGFAYANQFRPRAAYSGTLEDSIYVAADATRRGVGKTLLAELIKQCIALGMRQMLALIGDSGNAASIAVHRACGFVQVGVMTDVGRKLGRWVDVVIMQRALAQPG